MAIAPKTRQLVDELERHFLIPFSIEDEARSIRDRLRLLPDAFAAAAETFVDRLTATMQTTAAPFILAHQSARDIQYQRLFMAERIRARNIEAEPSESEEALEARRDLCARATANSRMDAFCESKEGVDVLGVETASFLLYLHKTPVVQSVARELLLQGAVATWSALEMLVEDELTLLINSRPDLVAKLLSDPAARKKFEIPKLSAEDLASLGFDLSNRMGHLLFAERDFSNLQVVKCACEALIDSPSLRKRLTEQSIWILNQNRHLIVHRRGMVDEEYLKKTSSRLSLGEQLSVSPKEFEEQLRQILATGDEFLNGLVSIARSA